MSSKNKYVVRMQEDVAPATDTNCEVLMTFERATVRKNVIEGVHLVGFQAKNRVQPGKAPYIYKESALKQAVPLYENADIYLSHGEGNKERPVESKVGFVTNPRFKEGTGVIGDLVLNEKHPFYESMVWWATNKPDKLGMSHVATNLYDAKENAVVEVRKVHSVDIVSTPSTTDGLFKEGVVEDKIEERRLEQVMDAAWSLISEIQWPMQGNKLPMAERAVKVIPVIKDLLKEIGQIATKTKDDKESNMEIADITLDILKQKRSDLVATLSQEAVAAHTAVEAKVKESVKDIPETLRTELFVTMVREVVVANDDVKLTAIIADRKALVPVTQKEAVVVAAPPATPQVIKQSEAVKPSKLEKADVVALATRK